MSPTTVLLGIPVIQMIIFNQSIFYIFSIFVAKDSEEFLVLIFVFPVVLNSQQSDTI